VPEALLFGLFCPVLLCTLPSYSPVFRFFSRFVRPLVLAVSANDRPKGGLGLQGSPNAVAFQLYRPIQRREWVSSSRWMTSWVKSRLEEPVDQLVVLYVA
jgi:hypothetical protein